MWIISLNKIGICINFKKNLAPRKENSLKLNFAIIDLTWASLHSDDRFTWP